MLYRSQCPQFKRYCRMSGKYRYKKGAKKLGLLLHKNPIFIFHVLTHNPPNSMVQWHGGPKLKPMPGQVGVRFLYKLGQLPKPSFLTLYCLSPNYRERLLGRVSYSFHIIILCRLIYKQKALLLTCLSHP